MKIKKEIVLPVLGVLVAVVVTCGVSYALFTTVARGGKNNVMNAGTLRMTFSDTSSNSINLTNAVPVTDATGMKGTAYTFTIQNTGTLKANYALKIEEDEATYTSHNDANKKFPPAKLKLGITKNGSTEYKLYTKGMNIDTGSLNANASISYTIRIWIDYNAGNEVQGKHFHGKFIIEAVQENETVPNSPTDEACFTFSSGTITGYSNDCPKDVVIPSTIGGMTVTKIGTSAFESKKLTSVVFPNNLTIGSRAFMYNNLTELFVPNNTKMETATFAYNQLTSVTLEEGLTSIGQTAFAHNELTSIILPQTITEIDYNAFMSNKLVSVIFSKNLLTIKAGVFQNNQLTNISIPNGVTYIGDYAFSSNQLTNIIIPESVTTIARFAFQSNHLEKVVIPNSVMSIASESFSDNQLTSVIIKGKANSSAFTSYPSNSPFGWATGYSDANITWNG